MRKHSLGMVVFVLSLLLGCCQNQLLASHAMALDFTYECLGQNEYRFYLNFYQDCSGTINITAPLNWPTIYLNAQSCNEFIELPLSLDPQAVSTDTLYDAFGNVRNVIPNFEVSAICDEVESTCGGGLFQGVEKFVFTADYILPKTCNDWTISYSSCCRNDAITNLASPELTELYVEALINNTNGICNNAPTFTSLPVPYICVGQKSFYNHGVFDVDGNDLTFSLINPLTKGAAPIEIRPSFTATQPIRSVNNDFQFNQQSGQMEFTPRLREVDVVTVLVEEFNANGTLIGSVMRDIQVVILDCDNQQSQLVNIINLNENAALQIDETTFEVCPGARFTFEVIATDPDANDTLLLNTNLSTAIPDAEFRATGINPVNGVFSWQPAKQDIGYNSFTLSLLDNVCPIPSNQIFGFNIFVLEGVNAGGDKIKCSDDPVMLTAKGGSKFTWSSESDMRVTYQSQNGDTLMVNPNKTTTYFVESNLNEGCKVVDTVVVKVQNEFDYTISPTLNVCQFDEIQLLVEPDPANGPYTYLWEPSNAFTRADIANPSLIANATMFYTVSVSNNSGCSITDVVQVNVAENVPDLLVEASKDTICIGELIDLSVEVQVCEDCEVGEGNAETIDASPFNLIWEDAKIQMLFKAEELAEAKVQSGAINQLVLTVTEKSSTIDLSNFQIAMANTNANALNSILGFLDNTQNVFGPSTYTAQLGENVFLLDVPFIWDGNSNLVVEMCFDNEDGIWGAPDKVISTNTNFVSVLKGDTDGVSNCNLVGDEELTVRPDIQFLSNLSNNNLPMLGINWLNAANANNSTITVMPNNTAYYVVEVGSVKCSRTDSVQVFTHPQPSISLGEDVQVYAGETVQLTAEGNFTNFEWLTTQGLSDVNITNPIYALNQSTQLIIAVSNELNCINSDTLQITFEGCRAIEVPSAFSPNGDGINDKLQAIQLDDYTIFKQLIIANRYGELVFETNNLTIFWDGTFRGKKQPIGVFSYWLSYTCEDKLEQKSGTITLIR